MTEPLTALAKVATSPAQAKIFVAMLEAKGIPAHIEGDSLNDEFAVSQRMMNMSGVRVMVPASSLERAKLVLKPVEIDEQELTEQALEATEGAETPTPTPADRKRGGQTAGLIAIVATALAALFFVLWLGEANRYADDPLYRRVWLDGEWQTFLRSTNQRVFVQEDRNGDGVVERSMGYAPDGSWKWVAEDPDANGFERKLTVTRNKDLIVTWTRDSASSYYDRAVVTDAQGRVYQTLTWQQGKGFVIDKP